MRGLWWQGMRVEDAVKETELLSVTELEATLSELKGEIAQCALVANNKNEHPSRRSSARAALAKMVSLRRHIAAIVHREHENNRIEGDGANEEALANVQRAIDSKDALQAVQLLVDTLRRAWKLDR